VMLSRPADATNIEQSQPAFTSFHTATRFS